MIVPIEVIELLAAMTNALAHNTPIKPAGTYARRMRDMLVESGCIKHNGHFYVAACDD